MQNYLLDAASKVGDHFAAFGKLLITGFPGFAYGDPGNWPLGAVLVPLAVACCLLAAWQYWRLRGLSARSAPCS